LLYSSGRVVREVQVALRRAEREKRMALRTVERDLRNQLRSEVTGILLTSELALRNPATPPDVAAKLQLMQAMAEKMRVRLHVV